MPHSPNLWELIYMFDLWNRFSNCGPAVPPAVLLCKVSNSDHVEGDHEQFCCTLRHQVQLLLQSKRWYIDEICMHFVGFQ